VADWQWEWYQPLVELLAIPPNIRKNLSGSLNSLIKDGYWHLPPKLACQPEIMSRITTICLPITPLDDQLVWKHSPDGILSAKNAFDFLNPPSTVVPWDGLIWRSCIPPSSSFSFWHALHQKLPTDENLRSRSCVVVSICVLCYLCDESTSHLFMNFPFAVSIWTWLETQFQCIFDRSSLSSLLEGISRMRSSQIRDIFVSAVVDVIHTIWLFCNSVRFGSDVVSLHGAKAKIVVAVALSGSVSNGKCLPSDSRLLNSFMISSHHIHVAAIIIVVWKAPTLPFVKVSTDGSVVDGLAACGGIFS